MSTITKKSPAHLITTDQPPRDGRRHAQGAGRGDGGSTREGRHGSGLLGFAALASPIAHEHVSKALMRAEFAALTHRARVVALLLAAADAAMHRELTTQCHASYSMLCALAALNIVSTRFVLAALRCEKIHSCSYATQKPGRQCGSGLGCPIDDSGHTEGHAKKEQREGEHLLILLKADQRHLKHASDEHADARADLTADAGAGSAEQRDADGGAHGLGIQTGEGRAPAAVARWKSHQPRTYGRDAHGNKDIPAIAIAQGRKRRDWPGLFGPHQRAGRRKGCTSLDRLKRNRCVRQHDFLRAEAVSAFDSGASDRRGKEGVERLSCCPGRAGLSCTEGVSKRGMAECSPSEVLTQGSTSRSVTGSPQKISRISASKARECQALAHVSGLLRATARRALIRRRSAMCLVSPISCPLLLRPAGRRLSADHLSGRSRRSGIRLLSNTALLFPMERKQTLTRGKARLACLASRQLTDSALGQASAGRNVGLLQAELREFRDDLLPVHCASIAVANLHVNRYSELRFISPRETPYMNSIGNRIKGLLPASRHTQKSLAIEAGMTQSHMSELISGKKDPEKLAVGPFMRMCVELSTTPEYLFYGQGEVMADARTGAEAQLLMLFRMVPDDRKELLLDLLKTAAYSGNDVAL